MGKTVTVLYSSNGHGSMLQYALLHLTGYDLSIEDLNRILSTAL